MGDLTASYAKALDDREATVIRAARLLADQKVIFVRGFLSEAVVKIGEMLRRPPPVPDVREMIEKIGARIPGFLRPKPLGPLAFEYFDEQISWLVDHNILHSAVVIESEASIPENAEIILKEIEDPRQSITIVSHSKGCLDVLEALLQHEPDRWRHVVRWIAIQGPFLGTPIAGFIDDRKPLRVLADAALSSVGGSIESLRGMRIDARNAYHRDRKSDIDALLSEVPTICQATSIASSRLWETFLGASLLLIEELGGGPNDGLVPIGSAVLPGADHVARDDVDHAMPVMRSFGSFARVDNLLALICACGPSRNREPEPG